MGNALRVVIVLSMALLSGRVYAAPLCANGQVWNPTGPVTQTGGTTVSVLPTFTGRNLTDTTQGGWQNSVGVPEKVLMVCSNGPILKAHEAQMSFVSASTNGAQSRIDASYSGNQTSDVGCNGGGVTSAPINATFRVTGACGANVPDPEPTECEEKRDDGSLRNRLLFVSPGHTGLICDSGCMMNLGTVNTDTGESTHLRINTAGGGANYTQGVRATYTGQTCSGTPQLSDVEVDLETMPGGNEGVCKGTDPKACIIPEKPNCGHVNGEYRCFTANNLTPENPCNTTASGAVFCRADAPDSAKPNNGTEGQPATPDVEFTLQRPGDTNGTVINYYKPSTVQGDSNDPGNDDDGDHAGNGDCGSAARPCKVEVVNGDEIGGGGDGGGEGDGEGSASGEGCEVSPTCDGDPVQCFLVKKQWETMCALAVPANDQADAAIEAAAGEGGMEEGSLIPEYDPDGGEPGINVLEQLQGVITSASGDGSGCIADLPLSLSIGGRAANSVVPLSQMCDLFKIIGLFVMLSAGMRSAWIIMRGYGG